MKWTSSGGGTGPKCCVVRRDAYMAPPIHWCRSGVGVFGRRAGHGFASCLTLRVTLWHTRGATEVTCRWACWLVVWQLPPSPFLSTLNPLSLSLRPPFQAALTHLAAPLIIPTLRSSFTTVYSPSSQRVGIDPSQALAPPHQLLSIPPTAGTALSQSPCPKRPLRRCSGKRSPSSTVETTARSAPRRRWRATRTAHRG